jgi:protein-disulfide isomerase
MEDPAILAAIDRNLELARALRIDGTPGFVIGEQIARGAIDLDTMEGLIRSARGKK